MKSHMASWSGVESVEIQSFGSHPVTSRFHDSCDSVAPRFALGLSIQRQTGLIQLSETFPISELKPRHPWLTCFEPEDHLDDLSEELIKLPGVDRTTTFGGFSFKDDSTIERIKALGYKSCWRLCPQQDLGINDNLFGIETLISNFCSLPSSITNNNHTKADVLVVRHVLEHAYDLPDFITKIKGLVKGYGYVVFEVPDCERSFDVGDCTVLWEEHVSYFTKRTLRTVLETFGFEIFDLYSVTYPLENSLVAIVKVSGGGANKDGVRSNYYDEEVRRVHKFVEQYSARKSNIYQSLLRVKSEYGTIAVFGAGHLTFTFISLCGLEKLIEFIVDDDSNKTNLVAPVGGIRILKSEALYELQPKLCLLGTNPIKHSALISRYSDYLKLGGLFASIFPGTTDYFEDLSFRVQD